MISWLNRKIYLYVNRYMHTTNSTLVTIREMLDGYRKENQSLSGRIKILEEQHDIMHNFLVEINKYLVKLTEK